VRHTDDRELLEKAAKAAGIDGKQDHYGVWIKGSYDAGGTVWNPLTDDGDALRLAVKCKLTTCTDGEATVSSHEAYRGSQGVFITQRVSECKDKYAATRRAIVKAAAAIGEGM
jgi:hypothetical protein